MLKIKLDNMEDIKEIKNVIKETCADINSKIYKRRAKKAVKKLLILEVY